MLPLLALSADVLVTTEPGTVIVDVSVDRHGRVGGAFSDADGDFIEIDGDRVWESASQVWSLDLGPNDFIATSIGGFFSADGFVTRETCLAGRHSSEESVTRCGPVTAWPGSMHTTPMETGQPTSWIWC